MEGHDNKSLAHPYSTNRPTISQNEHSPDILSPQYPNNFTTAIAPHPAARTCDSCVVAIISEIASLYPSTIGTLTSFAQNRLTYSDTRTSAKHMAPAHTTA